MLGDITAVNMLGNEHVRSVILVEVVEGLSERFTNAPVSLSSSLEFYGDSIVGV